MTAPPVTEPPLEGEWPPHPHVDWNLRYRCRFSTRQAGLWPARVRRVRSWREVSPQQPIRVCLRCVHGLGAKQAVRGRLRPRVLRCGPLRFAVSGCGNGRSADTARLRYGVRYPWRVALVEGLGFPQRSGRRSGSSGERVSEVLHGVWCPAREITLSRCQGFDPVRRDLSVGRCHVRLALSSEGVASWGRRLRPPCRGLLETAPNSGVIQGTTAFGGPNAAMWISVAVFLEAVVAGM